jgi:hypothetical protein
LPQPNPDANADTNADTNTDGFADANCHGDGDGPAGDADTYSHSYGDIYA